MWSQGYKCSQNMSFGSSGQQKLKRAALQILPCTVSQLLSAAEVYDAFRIGDYEINQVSVVGVIRAYLPSSMNVKYSVDDMTSSPVTVTQWVNTEDPGLVCPFSPGTYVKVSGSLRNFNGQRLLVASNSRCLDDVNELTSHMLEVVHAHMLLSGTSIGETGGMPENVHRGGYSEAIIPYGLSTIQGQVLSAIKRCPHPLGISFRNLRGTLQYLGVPAIRTSLAFLVTEGHIYSTIDEHFKSTDGGT